MSIFLSPIRLACAKEIINTKFSRSTIMVRTIFSIIAGNISWTILWLTFNTILTTITPKIGDGSTPISSIPLLLLLLVYSVIISIITGYITASVATHNQLKHVFALGILQLSMGIFFQSQAWHLLPIWYHLSFLALLIPCNIFGGWWRMK